MQCFQDAQGDEIFTMAVGENEQGPSALADTIRWWEQCFPSGGMAKW
ncbi:hypothetical protein [Synechococcus sp. UW105]|nr:hypothetical protein [Synechococcus sp. UW105]